MDIRIFNTLSLQEKDSFLQRNGSFLGQVAFHSFILKLYKAEGHLYEVWCSAIKEKVEKIEPIPDLKNLPSYLKRAGIPGLT